MHPLYMHNQKETCHLFDFNALLTASAENGECHSPWGLHSPLCIFYFKKQIQKLKTHETEGKWKGNLELPARTLIRRTRTDDVGTGHGPCA